MQRMRQTCRLRLDKVHRLSILWLKQDCPSSGEALSLACFSDVMEGGVILLFMKAKGERWR